jgi:hypothetical protein
VHYAGQVGDEATPAEYLDALAACTAEWMRVLKPGGSIFVNLGDKYAGSAPGAIGASGSKTAYTRDGYRGTTGMGIATKSLFGLPWRYAIRCIDDLGLILRAEIVWSKPNGLPESVTDRVRRSHEQVFHFVKQSRYFSAVDEVREAQDPVNLAHHAKYRGRYVGTNPDRRDAGTGNFEMNPLGKLPGSVWTIPTVPLTVPDHLGVDHFAAYPPELVRRIVLGWSPREVCTACGEGRRPVVDRVTSGEDNNARAKMLGRAVAGNAGMGGSAFWKMKAAGGGDRLTGYACACPDTTAPATPGVVLDPFGGTGTTALVASVFGRRGISVDLSADYCRLARWRTRDPSERARVLGVPKPEPVPEAQMDLFGEWSA